MRIHSPSKVMEEYFKYKSMHNNDLLVSLYKQPITKKYKFLEEVRDILVVDRSRGIWDLL